MVSRVRPEDLGHDQIPRARIRGIPRAPAGMVEAVRTLAELAGLGALVAAAWTVDVSAGLAALGVGLIIAANYAGRSGVIR